MLCEINSNGYCSGKVVMAMGSTFFTKMKLIKIHIHFTFGLRNSFAHSLWARARCDFLCARFLFVCLCVKMKKSAVVNRIGSKSLFSTWAANGKYSFNKSQSTRSPSFRIVRAAYSIFRASQK